MAAKDKDAASILVIDDDKNQRSMLAFALRDQGHDVVAVENGEKALSAARAKRFDVAICDIMMPGLDGVATLKALKQQYPRLEVIMATGYATPGTAVASLKLGAFNYIAKPYELKDLLAILEKAIIRSRKTD
ncbi:MAG: response regulator [Elusimicrobiota bacterium]|jgi:DNA-binding NtrC family response regulator